MSAHDDLHFLSASNPIATVDQRDMEAFAIRILQMPQVQDAKLQAAARWRTMAGRNVPQEAWARFDELIGEWAFNYVLKAVNSDPNYPRVLGHLYAPPHEWFGMQVPGSRGSGGDGPDQSYSIVPVDGHARFEVHGRRFDPAPADVPFTLVGNPSMTMTLASLEWDDVVFKADNSFVITLDPEPPGGRVNHLQTNIDTRFLFIRDCRADWRQVPNAYRVRRLDPPVTPPLTLEQVADRAARWMIDDVTASYWFIRSFEGLEANTIAAPFGTGRIGGLVSQRISLLRLVLADDEACVVTLGAGGARFRDIVLMDRWFRTIDYWKRSTSMNNAQGLANADGSTTYVIAQRDPGVHNWLDTAGLHELLIVHRWQGLPRTAVPEGEPWSKAEVVKFAALAQVLPAELRRVTASERQRQLDERLETFNLRFVDH